MNKKKNLSYIVKKIEENENKLCFVENNLQYIKVLKALYLWLSRLSMFQNSVEYQAYFISGAGFSFFDRVQNSILEYQYGNKPF